MKIRVPHPLWILSPALVLVVLILGFHFGLPAYRRHSAIATIRRLDGHVLTQPTGPAWVRSSVGAERMAPFDKVTSIGFGVATVQDIDVATISVLTDVETVSFSKSQVSDAGIECLGRLPNLRMIDFVETPVTEAAVRHLSRFRTLRVVSFARTGVTDSGLRHLEGAKDLLLVTLFEEPSVTDGGVAALQRALPGTKINR